MPEFDWFVDFWKFEKYVKYTSRHIMNAEQQNFLDRIRDTGEKRKQQLAAKTCLWRAQLAHEVKEHVMHDDKGNALAIVERIIPASRERMIPLPDRAMEGRANAKGIPCWYFSDDQKTAMAEVRPWIGSIVTISVHEVVRDLTLLDCTLSLETKRSAEAEVWRTINAAFSQPVTRTDDVADYAPTQILAELFRSIGCQGLVYGSRVGKGKTIAIFDLTAARGLRAHLQEVIDVNFEFTQVSRSRYYSKRQKSAPRRKS
jgi:RES domain-containing protein